jgi:glycosyltransferase involved in cell wall biosynthesis
VYTHEQSNAPWSGAAKSDTHTVWFGPGELAEQQSAPWRQWHEWRKGGRIIDWLQRQEIGAVAVSGYNDLGRTRIIRWCRSNNIPCFLFADSNIRGDTAAGLRAHVKRAYVSWAVRSCAGVMPFGSLGREYFLKYGADPKRIFYFPCEPDYGLIEGLPEQDLAEARARFGFSSGRRRVLYCGRLVRVKRVDLLIDAFAALASELPDWDLIVIGDGPLRDELFARVPASLKDRVKWLGFIDDQKLISAIYRNCDVLALPSEYEPWALVVNEGAAAGLALLTSDAVGAAAELVRDGVNGAVFVAGNPSDLLGKLRTVTDPSQVDRLKAGSRTVLASWRTTGDPVEGMRRALGSVIGSCFYG